MNVWLVLSHERHAHHPAAKEWFESATDASFCFCRFTQLGLLRLLTNGQVMGSDALSQRDAWRVYERWLEDSRVEFRPEPYGPDFERFFRSFRWRLQPSPKLWADAYLAAFAKAAGMTVVTFDGDFRTMGGTGVEILAAPRRTEPRP